MLDPTNFSAKLSASALEGPQHGRYTSISTGSSRSCSPPTAIHHCTACWTLFSRSEPSQNRGSLKSPRPLPIPPLFAPPLPTLSTSSSPTPSLSTSSVTSTAPHLLSCRSRSVSARPLPKMPRSTPSPLGTIRRGTSMNERTLPPTSPVDLAASLSAPQQPANSKEIRRGSLSRLQYRPGISAPTDLVPPNLDAGELSDSQSSNEKHYYDLPLALITPECLSGPTDAIPPILDEATDDEPGRLVRQYSCRWLREKNGRRWVEENYDTIAQCLRELR
ncbi:hypothetical protein BJY52DRAFT_543040 [Lactarius psammicola]|nr:hypothetical protein BJY52DRAFT_543040 [Lactarius psammicola]